MGKDSTLQIAMILAAGYGKRMGDLTNDLPKPLLPVGKYRIIEILLKKLAAQGIERAVINLHYLPDVVREALGDGRRYGLEIIYSEEPELLGSGGGIANAEKWFEGQTIVAVNADTFCDLDLQALFRFHRENEALVTMNVLPSRNNFDYSLVLYDEQQNLQRFLLRRNPFPPRLQSGIFTGHQILSPTARAYLKAENQSIISELYVRGIEENQTVKVFRFDGQWIDIGTSDFYCDFVRRIENGDFDLAPFMR